MNNIVKKCLSLSREERESLVNVLIESLEYNDVGKSLEEIHNAVVKVFGKEILTDKRNREEFIGRVIFSYISSLEGYSEISIGGYVNRNHSSVNMMKKTMKGWMAMPRFYSDEMELYNKVRQELNYETN